MNFRKFRKNNQLLENVILDYDYKKLYTKHILEAPNVNQGVGGADETEVAENQTKILIENGLTPNSKVYEIGSGTGRILESLKHFLVGENAKYFGIDVVPELVKIGNKRISSFKDAKKYRMLECGPNEIIDPGYEIDYCFGFSVFTHMEAEDIYNKLKQLRLISNSKTIGLFTFLALEHTFGKVNFYQEADLSTESRYRRVRNISYTFDYANRIIELAGWKVITQSWNELDTTYVDGFVQTNQSYLCIEIA
jgi:hypothetical protein